MTTKAEKEKIIADTRAALEAELREQIRAEVMADIVASQPEPIVVDPVAAPQVVDPGPPAFEPIDFWAVTPNHSPRLKRAGGNGFIKFVNGHYRAMTADEAEHIRVNLHNQVFESDLAPHMRPKPDEITGYAPRSFLALEAYREYITPIYPEGWVPPSN